MAGYTLTIRNGPRVTREEHRSLSEAIEALRERTGEIQAEGGLEEVKMIRTFTPDQRVKARLELSTGSLVRKREAGLDVMGDGTLVPYRGGILRRPLEREQGAGTDPFDEIAAALRR